MALVATIRETCRSERPNRVAISASGKALERAIGDLAAAKAAQEQIGQAATLKARDDAEKAKVTAARVDESKKFESYLAGRGIKNGLIANLIDIANTNNG